MAERAPTEAPNVPGTPRRVIATRLLVLVGAIVALVLVVRTVGTDEVIAAVVRAAPLLPLAALLEALRIALDGVATKLALGGRGRAVPLSMLIASHLVAHGVMNVMPAGRASSEVAKGSMLARYLGAPAAIAMGTTNQANVLLSSALFSLPCALAAHVALGDTALTLAIVAHFVVLFVAGGGLRVLQTRPIALAWIERTFPSRAEAARAFVSASRQTPLLSAAPITAMALGRLCQTAEYAVLAHAVGVPVDALRALAVQGVNLVAAAVGVMVPGQVGSAEAVFALAAQALGTTGAEAVSIALLAHTVSLGYAALGLAVLAVWVSLPRTSDEHAS